MGEQLQLCPQYNKQTRMNLVGSLQILSLVIHLLSKHWGIAVLLPLTALLAMKRFRRDLTTKIEFFL